MSYKVLFDEIYAYRYEGDDIIETHWIFNIDCYIIRYRKSIVPGNNILYKTEQTLSLVDFLKNPELQLMHENDALIEYSKKQPCFVSRIKHNYNEVSEMLEIAKIK